MNPELLAKYDGVRVPRYTSYPTAPHFNDAVDEVRALSWLGGLGELNGGTTASIYLHIPFCHSMCWYCGCHTWVVSRYQPVADYLELLKREIALIATAVPGRLRVGHLHWGGGTPNMVRPDDFSAIMAMIRHGFDLIDGARIAVEIDPRSLTVEHVRAMAAAGVNRASLGVQDFDAGSQRAVNRIQPFEMTANAVETLRAGGITAINFDLMYGLPLQTVETCRRSAELALTLRPQRMAVFGYAHVPWMKKHQNRINEAELPDGITRWRQFAAIADTLNLAGLQSIGIDHFAVPEDELAVAQRAGRLRRNFQGYTADCAEVLIGLGASAIGAMPLGYVQNAPDFSNYEALISDGHLAVTRGLVLSVEDRLRREVIERLMCDLGVDLELVTARHGFAADHFDAVLPRLAALAADGALELRGRRLTVPEAARPLIRLSAAAFDTYLAPSQDAGAARHSRAI
ncbi:MAG: oxygen-independent coproporphyrinogen III oxidase [Rhodospirillaceae bacterium]